MRRALALGFGIPATLLVAAGLYYYGPGVSPGGQPPMVSLPAGGTALKAAFNHDQDWPRMLVLVAPT